MTHHIVVLGAGYSGLVAAKLAARRTGAAVTLINQRDYFVERIRMHMVAADRRLRRLPLTRLLDGSGVTLVVDTVTKIDANAKTVELASRAPMRYDTLIYAVGSRADLDMVPGAAEHAFTVATPDQADRLRQRLRDSRTAAVVGGGLTGIEVASELAESRPDLKVRLITGDGLGQALSQRGRQHLRTVFHALGVDVHETAQVGEVRGDGVVLEDGEHLDADTVIWTTGFRVPELARDAGITVDDRGRMVVDETLRSVSHPDVYGAGDAAASRLPDGRELRMACATGIPVGQQVAKAIGARLAGRTPKPLHFRYFQQCISLGRRDGLIQFVRTDDSPVEAVITGRPAAAYKEAILKATILSMRHPWIPGTA